jgi:uncharacterized membrane protein YkoI
MTRKTFMVCLLAGLLAWTATVPAEARRDDRKDDRRDDRREARRDDRADRSPRREEVRRDGISLDEAVTRVRRETGGRVLSAEGRDGRYRIKVLLPNGAVRVVNVDARSGRMD